MMLIYRQPLRFYAMTRDQVVDLSAGVDYIECEKKTEMLEETDMLGNTHYMEGLSEITIKMQFIEVVHFCG